MKNIVIVGSGGFAKEVAFLIDQINEVNETWNLLGFIDANVGQSNGKYSVFNNDEWLVSTTDQVNVVFGVGNPALLKKLVKKFSVNSSIEYPNLIHPNVIKDSNRISIGVGNVVCASNTFTTDIKIGNFNVFNIDCTVGHDTIIGDYNIINPSVNISGGVQVGNEVLLGTNSIVLQYKQICSKSIIGAGALITKDVLIPGTYIGSPAKKIVK